LCDFSLQAVKSRAAKVGDKLFTKNFGTGTSGFACHDNPEVAVCVLPGTEIAFEEPFKTREWGSMWAAKKHSTVAIFRQINKDNVHTHHDALETPSGEVVLLTGLIEGQQATVLQLPAAPKTEKEAEDQKRLVVAG
jgi:hypothetical protein